MTNSGKRFFNREFSWIEFDRRVLEEAQTQSIPILERLKFLSISSSNLDEFFMVRVGGIGQLRDIRHSGLDPSGLSADEQLSEIHIRCHEMVKQQYDCFQEIEGTLEESGIRRVSVEGLAPNQFSHIEKIFETEIFPIITPMAVSSFDDFPLLPGLGLNLGVRLKGKGKENELFRFALIPLPKKIPRFVNIPGESGDNFVLLEDVIGAFLDRLFPGEPTIEHFPFRITRNADLIVSEDQASDFLEEMKEVLIARKISDCVRLEVVNTISQTSMNFLVKALKIEQNEIYSVPGPINLGAYMSLSTRQGFSQLKFEPWTPQPAPEVVSEEGIMKLLSKKDILLFHPYQSFDPVVKLIEEAAEDPDVIAIKQILYRTSEGSRIVEALAKAAALDKHVTALVELKARFDEARNIEWAQSLERAGVQVIYGLRGLKVHAKVCVIVRREPGGIRRYLHFGTGNYNERTARTYCDVSLMTCSEDLGSDASAFFNAICGYSQPIRYNRIEAAPIGLKKRLLEMIESEAERSRQGQPAKIMAKINSLVDTDVIEALYKASCAGVKIFLNVRGICCLIPEIPGMSENIKVVSIIDRYLEHARILYFQHGGDNLLFISSADWMPRNLEKRVELLIPVEQSHCRDRLMNLLESAFKDNTQAHLLEPDGSYKRIKSPKGKSFRSQEYLYEIAKELGKSATKERRTVFEPQFPQSKRKVKK
ncbi:MAG: polyphosphate kinase 1 [Candidatus Riflebacteria bacterium]|nr:polyphosphate kinase 1 [Candidatus Riflebacteria bacterium]